MSQEGTHQFLSLDQARQLNDIYMNIVRKYRNNATESVWLDTFPRLTLQDAQALAETEVADRRNRILDTYNARVKNIEDNATARGLMDSTIVLEQLDRAYARKAESDQRLDNIEDKLVKKILADNSKLALQVEREKSISKSRSLRDFVTVSKMKLTVPYNAQTLIDNEVYDAYLAWCINYPPQLAWEYVNTNAVFLLNMTVAKRAELIATLNTRRLTTG